MTLVIWRSSGRTSRLWLAGVAVMLAPLAFVVGVEGKVYVKVSVPVTVIANRPS